MKETKIEGTERVFANLDQLSGKFLTKAKRIIDIDARLLQSYIRTEKMTGGTTESRLKVRSGRLRASVIPIKTKLKENLIEGGVSIGTVYGRVHVGPKGQVTTIRPKRAKYLTIPLPDAMTGAGVVRGSSMFGPWGKTFIAKSKAGNLIIFGQRASYSKVKAGGVAVKGIAIKNLRSQVVPLFVLKKEVKVKARIHPEELIAWIKPKMIEDFLKGGIEVK